jgi:hypothetical protein
MKVNRNTIKISILMSATKIVDFLTLEWGIFPEILTNIFICQGFH